MKTIYRLKRYGIPLLPILLLSFSPWEGEFKTVHYHSLLFIKNAEAPHPVQMVKTDNPPASKRSLTNGLLFSYKSRTARRVQIAGTFSQWKPLTMTRNGNGVWYYYLEEPSSKKDISYKYCVDGIWIIDPLNADRSDDGMGSYLSLIRYPERGEGKQVTYRFLRGGSVEFRIYRPGAGMVSLVGDFNHWNPENDLLKKGPDGIWRIQKKLPRGRYRYRYVIDGTWSVDLFNEKSASDDTGELCSLIQIR